MVKTSLCMSLQYVRNAVPISSYKRQHDVGYFNMGAENRVLLILHVE